MQGLNFSDFYWWIWLVIGVGAFIAVIEGMDISCRRKYEIMKALLLVALGLVGLFCVAIGFRHFVLWAAGG